MHHRETPDLRGKTALVTGASRGIGRAIALRLAAAGAHVIVHYGRSAESAQALVAELRASGVQAEAIAADLSDHAQVLALADATLATLERWNIDALDILVNNAGLGCFNAFAETSIADFELQFAVNVRAPVFLIQRLLPRIRNGGRVINISSAVTRCNFFADSAALYAASKGALDVLTRYLAEIAGARRITVNSVNPGVILTDMSAIAQTPEGAQAIQANQALKRLGQPEDVAHIVAFLASPQAEWITGQHLDASGGSRL